MLAVITVTVVTAEIYIYKVSDYTSMKYNNHYLNSTLYDSLTHVSAFTDPLCSTVLILNPKVGEIV